MKKIFEYIKNNKQLILFFVLATVFFSFSILILWDSAHYLSYLSILKGNLKWSTWDPVRGIIFPAILRFTNIIF